MKNLNIWHKSWHAINENTVVLGRMYRSLLSCQLFNTTVYPPTRIFQYVGGYIVLKLILVLSTPQKKQCVTRIAFLGVDKDRSEMNVPL